MKGDKRTKVEIMSSSSIEMRVFIVTRFWLLFRPAISEHTLVRVRVLPRIEISGRTCEWDIGCGASSTGEVVGEWWEFIFRWPHLVGDLRMVNVIFHVASGTFAQL